MSVALYYTCNDLNNTPMSGNHSKPIQLLFTHPKRNIHKERYSRLWTSVRRSTGNPHLDTLSRRKEFFFLLLRQEKSPKTKKRISFIRCPLSPNFTKLPLDLRKVSQALNMSMALLLNFRTIRICLGKTIVSVAYESKGDLK